MYVILRIWQYLYISELQIFSGLSMHNIKITAARNPLIVNHLRFLSLSEGSLNVLNLASQVMSRGLSG